MRLPDVPVTVTEVVPVAEEELEIRVRTLVVVVLAGLKAAETPVGKPVADSATVPVNPFCGTTVIVAVTAPPWPTLGLFGDADSVKLGCAPVPPPPLLLLPPPHPVKAKTSTTAIPRHGPCPLLVIDDSRRTRIQNAHESLPIALRRFYFACGWINSASMVIERSSPTAAAPPFTPKSLRLTFVVADAPMR